MTNMSASALSRSRITHLTLRRKAYTGVKRLQAAGDWRAIATNAPAQPRTSRHKFGTERLHHTASFINRSSSDGMIGACRPGGGRQAPRAARPRRERVARAFVTPRKE